MTITDKPNTTGGQGGSSSQEHGTGVGIMAEPMMQEAAGKAIPAGYQQTEVGVIPNSWSIQRLANITTLIIDGTHHTPVYTSHGVPFLRVTDIQGEFDETRFKHISVFEHEQLIKRCHPQNGDLLLSKNGTIGIPRVVDWDWEFSVFVSLALIKLKRECLNVHYLEQFFRSDFLAAQLAQRSKQGTVTNLHLEEIREILVPLPPSLKEQTAIANVLSDSDALIDALEQLIAKKQAIKSGTMQQLLTGRTRLPAFALRLDGTKKGYKPSELGDIPEDWVVAPFGNLFETSISRKNLRATEVVSFVGMQDVTETAQLHNQTSITYEKVKTGFTYFECGDVLVAKITPCFENGKGCHTKSLKSDVGFGSTEFHVLRATANADSDFIYYWTTQACFRKQLESEMVGSAGHRRVPLPAIQSYMIPCSMNKKEQTAIATILSDMDNELQALTQKLEKARALKQGMMQQLLTGKIRLPLEVQA